MRCFLWMIVAAATCGSVPAWADEGVPSTDAVPSASGAWMASEWTTPAYASASRRLVRRPTSAWHIGRGPWRPRGPVEVRDEWLLAQPRLTLPAVSPDPIPRGAWQVRFHVNRGSDFGWDQSGPAEAPTDRRFLVDGEHQTTEVGVRYGLMPRLSVGLRVPVRWRGGGFMDAIIDKFHELTEPIGFKDNGRPAFRRDLYRVEGRDAAGNPLSWNDERGTGLGNVELEAHWNVVQPCCRSDWRAAVIARLGLPTGTGPFDVGGVDAGLQVVAAKQVGPRFDLYGGLGGTFFGEDVIRGIEYETWRAHAFFAIEYQVASSWSLVVETDFASRLVTNLANYPAEQWYLHLAGRWDINSKVEMEIGFTENLADQQSTIDFGAFLGFIFRF